MAGKIIVLLTASNLSELYLTIGDVPQAVTYARQSVEYADKSEDGFQREVGRTTLADALHRAGEMSEALGLFEEAEAMQKERQPEYPYLYSLRGFRYCDLLLSQGKHGEVLARAGKALEIVLNGSRNLLAIALNILSLGKAHFLQTQEQKTPDFKQAEAYLNQAVEGLVKAGQQQELPRGLLARAALYRLKADFSKAHSDADEVFDMADRSDMKLFLTDYHIESCRLALAQDNPEQARTHLSAAKKRI